MPTINLAYIAELVVKYARKYAYSLAIVFFIIVLVAMITSFVASFYIFYNLITAFLLHMSGAGSNGLVSKMFALMSCIGFTQAFNDTKALLISSVLFLLWRIVYGQFISAYYLLLKAIAPLVD